MESEYEKNMISKYFETALLEEIQREFLYTIERICTEEKCKAVEKHNYALSIILLVVIASIIPIYICAQLYIFLKQFNVPLQFRITSQRV